MTGLVINLQQLAADTGQSAADLSAQASVSQTELSLSVTALGGASLALSMMSSTLDETKILTLVNGTFVAADPCWGEYSSSSIGC